MTRPRVLLVDDNAALVANLRDILEGDLRLHPQVHAAHNGSEALAYATAHGFDVALVDVQLPDGSGVDIAQRLRVAQPLGEVVLITGYATVDSAIAALSAGAFAFLLKSFRPEELLSTVGRAVDKVRLQRERDELSRGQRAVFDTEGVLLVAVAQDDRIVLFNPRVAELTASGVPMDAGAKVASYVSAQDRERVLAALSAARGGDRNVSVEAGLTDGKTVHSRRVEWHLSGVGTGELVYGIGIDVTERRNLERRAAEAEALSAMGSIALGLAHEIRNPLNAAVLQLHLLGRAVDKLPDEEGHGMKRRIGIVQDEIARLERLLTEFLELARPRGIQRGQVDLASLVRSVMALEGEALSKAKINVTTHLAEDVLVTGDSEKLKQVLLNITANARDAMSEGGNLQLKVENPEEPRLTIEDDGPGIGEEVLASIFDAFFTTKPAGTGLGLAIVKKIIDQHGGTIDIEPLEGAGTRVVIQFPSLQKTRDLPRGTGSSGRIAVVR